MSPRRKKERENFLDTDVSGKVTAEPERIDAEDEELDTVFGAFPQHDACIELFRTTEKGGKPAFLEDITPADFSFGYVCNTYGGGRYIAKGKYKDGSVVKRNFDIEGESFPVKRKIPMASAPIVGPQPSPVQTIEIQRKEDGSFDTAAVMSSMMNMMKGMIQESKGSKSEWLAELKEMRSIFGAGEKPQTPVAEAISMLKQGIELGSAAGSDGGIPWMLIVDKLQGPLTDLVSALTRRPVNVNPGVQFPPQPAPIQPGAEAQPQPVQEGEGMEFILLGALKAMIPMLVTGAAQGAEEGFYCDFMLDQIPRQYYATAKTWLEKPGCVDQLEKMNAGVRAYRAWFDKLQTELLISLNERLNSDATRTLQPEPGSDATADRSADL